MVHLRSAYARAAGERFSGQDEKPRSRRDKAYPEKMINVSIRKKSEAEKTNCNTVCGIRCYEREVVWNGQV